MRHRTCSPSRSSGRSEAENDGASQTSMALLWQLRQNTRDQIAVSCSGGRATTWDGEHEK